MWLKYFVKYQKLYYINVKLILTNIVLITVSILIRNCKSQKYDNSYKNIIQVYSSVLLHITAIHFSVYMFSNYTKTINFNLKLYNLFIYYHKFEICLLLSLLDSIYNSNYSVFLNISISHYCISLLLLYLILIINFLYNAICIFNFLYLTISYFIIKVNQNSFMILGNKLNCDSFYYKILVFLSFLKYL